MRRLPALLLLAALAAAAFLLHAGWGRWPDVLADFGRELFVPWRLSEGDVLYRDVACFDGPLPYVLNALWFRVFGAGLWTLVALNGVLLVAFGALLFRELRAVSSTLAAALALWFFTAVFALGQQTPIGNYSFLAPYAHGATHGLFLALGAMACARSLVERGGPSRAIACGLCLGAAFLTKAELFFAALVGVATTLVLARERRHLAALASAALVPPLVAFGLLATAMPASAAALGTVGSWRGVFDAELTGLPFYRRGMGFDAPAANLLLLLRAFGVLALAIGPAFLLGFALRGRPRAASRAALPVFLLTLVAWRLAPTDWRWLARVQPIVLLVILAAGRPCLARLGSEPERARYRGFLAFAAFGLALLAKIVLDVRFGFYGFVLAVPASCALLAFLVDWFPRLTFPEPRDPSCAGARAVGIAGVLAVTIACGWALAQKSAAWFALKEAPVGEGVDAFVADGRGRFVTRLRAELARRLAPEDTLLVLPEGVMLAYLERRRVSTPYHTHLPPELILFGEQRMLAALAASPPDAVVLVQRDTSEYGVPRFGADYGRELSAWIAARYRTVWTDPEGGTPLEPGSIFGLSLLLPGP